MMHGSRVRGAGAGVVLAICAFYRIALRGTRMRAVALDLSIFLIWPLIGFILPFYFVCFLVHWAFYYFRVDFVFSLILYSLPTTRFLIHRLTRHPCETFTSIIHPNISCLILTLISLLHSYVSASCFTTLTTAISFIRTIIDSMSQKNVYHLSPAPHGNAVRG